MNVIRRSNILFAHILPRTIVLNKNRFIYSIVQRQCFPVTLPNNVAIEQCRNYSKAKDKGKDKKKSVGKVEINNAELSRYVDMDKMKQDYEDVVDSMKDEFAANFTLRSSVGVIETIKVHYEGKNYELQELAQIIRKNPKTVVLNMASIPQVIPEVLKALNDSGLNLNPQQDGTTVFIPVPKVTKEHRENLVRNAKILYNSSKTDMKQIPLKVFRKLKIVDKNISEDALYSAKKQINAMCDNYLETLKDVYLKKVAELGGSNP